jgi:hypothetical protein
LLSFVARAVRCAVTTVKEEGMAVIRKLGSSASRRLLRRVTKPIPIIGTAVVIVTAAGVLRRKGVFRGGVDIALDAVPVIGTAKGLIELVRGDFIPEKPPEARAKGRAKRPSKAA